MRLILASGVTSHRSLNRTAAFWWEVLEVLRDGIFNNLPRRPGFNGRDGLQFVSHHGSNRHEQFWIVADALRFTLLSRSFGRPTHALAGFFGHTLDYITNCLHFVI